MERIPKLFNKVCAARSMNSIATLYDRPVAQLSWFDLFGAYVNVDPGESLRPDAVGHGKALGYGITRAAREGPGAGQTALAPNSI